MGVGDALVAAVAVSAGAVALAVGSWRAAGALVGRDALDRAFAALTLALGALCVVMQVLGIAGVLSRWPVTVALVAVAAVVLWRVPAPEAEPGERARPGWQALAAIVIGAGAAGLGLALGADGFTSSTDALQYHVPNAGTWLREQSILELPIAVPGYPTNGYPSDHTLTGLWLMLATGSDQLVYLVNVAWGALTVLGTAALARALGGPATAGALLGLGVLLAPISFSTQVASLLSDWAATGGLVAGAAAALRAVRDPRPVPWAVVAGVALGLAVGSKYTALVAAAATVAIPVIAARRSGLRLAGVMIAAAAPLVAFWLIRDWVEFGNPLFPLDLGPLEGYTSPLTQLETHIASHLLDGDGEIAGRWLDLIAEFLGFAALLALLAVVAGVLALRRGDRLMALATGLVLVGLAVYMVTPYTGGGPEGLEFLIASQLRYPLPVLVVAAGIVAAWAGRWAWLVAAPLLVYGGLKLLTDETRPEVMVSARDAAAALAFAAAGAALALRPEPLRRAARLRAALPAAGFLLVLGAVAVLLHEQVPRPATVTERLLAQRCPGGTVGVLQVINLRAVMGVEFDVPVVAIDAPAPAGRRPIMDGEALDRRIAQLEPDLVVEGPGLTQPRGWEGPRGWEEVAREGRSSVWAPPGGGCAA